MDLSLLPCLWSHHLCRLHRLSSCVAEKLKIVHGSVSVTVPLRGSVPVAVAVSVTEGASESTTVCVSVPPVDAPGANVVVPRVTEP